MRAANKFLTLKQAHQCTTSGAIECTLTAEESLGEWQVAAKPIEMQAAHRNGGTSDRLFGRRRRRIDLETTEDTSPEVQHASGRPSVRRQVIAELVRGTVNPDAEALEEQLGPDARG